MKKAIALALMLAAPAQAQEWTEANNETHKAVMMEIIRLFCPEAETPIERTQCNDKVPNYSIVMAACAYGFSDSETQALCLRTATSVWSQNALRITRPPQ